MCERSDYLLLQILFYTQFSLFLTVSLSVSFSAFVSLFLSPPPSQIFCFYSSLSFPFLPHSLPLFFLVFLLFVYFSLSLLVSYYVLNLYVSHYFSFGSLPLCSSYETFCHLLFWTVFFINFHVYTF